MSYLRAGSRIRCFNHFSYSKRFKSFESASLTQSQSEKQTIFAPCTAPGKAAVSIVRISGPSVVPTYHQLTTLALPKARHMALRTLPGIDQCLVCYFPAPNSFTGEDVLEFHLHGSTAVLAAMMKTLAAQQDCRLAEPGEFARRAYLNTRMNLTEIEGLKNLIDAETEVQHLSALHGVTGGQADVINGLRAEILACMAKIEATIDFGEDANDVPSDLWKLVHRDVSSIRKKIQSYLNDNRRGEVQREGVKVTIFGSPNAGKSTFLNYLTARKAAITSPIPGTTRDLISVNLDLNGFKVILTDTAGIRNSDDVIESLGVDLAKQALDDADLAICILDARVLSQQLQELEEDLSKVNGKVIYVVNKCDLLGNVPATSMMSPVIEPQYVSALTGKGMQEFLKATGDYLNESYSDKNKQEPALITQSRHRIHLQNCSEFLRSFVDHGDQPKDFAMAAEELRYASQELGRINGRIETEEVLDHLFKGFCIGK